MQYRKCIALLAVVLVGFGVVAVDNASAATVQSITISTPADSGALRGIDSTFVVTVEAHDFYSIDRLECVIYLITGNDAATVVMDDAGQVYSSAASRSLATVGAGGTTTFDGMTEISTIILAGDGAVYSTLMGSVTGSTGQIVAASTFRQARW